MSQKVEQQHHRAQDKLRQERVKLAQQALYDLNNEKALKDLQAFQENLDIVDTMSGDPFKAAFELKERRRSKTRGNSQPFQNSKTATVQQSSPVNHFKRNIVASGVIGIQDLQINEERKFAERQSFDRLQK